VYSNFGYLILGLVIEKVSGISYEKYVTSLLESAGLNGFCLGKSKKPDKHSSEVLFTGFHDFLQNVSL
jgi:CubicO group peptidase (beta-lactamase class C family)